MLAWKKSGVFFFAVEPNATDGERGLDGRCRGLDARCCCGLLVRGLDARGLVGRLFERGLFGGIPGAMF